MRRSEAGKRTGSAKGKIAEGDKMGKSLGKSSSSIAGGATAPIKSRRRAKKARKPDRAELWVHKVLNFSSQYNSSTWAAKTVIGPPRVYPRYGDIHGAWAQQSISQCEWLEVEFEEKIYIEEVDVYETLNAGAVIKIAAKNPNGEWKTLFQTATPTVLTQSRIFSPPIQRTNFPANVLRVEQNCTAANSWCEIDCIQIKGCRYMTALPDVEDHLSKDLSLMVNNSLFSDVCFEVADSKFIHAHKAVLSCRCDYFRAMFCDGLRESSSSKAIPMLKENYESFLQLMTFLYTDDIDENVSTSVLVELMRVADRFNVGSLHTLSFVYLVEEIGIDNVVDIYIDATSSLPVLEMVSEHCLRFISMNLDKVSKTAAFSDLPQSSMLEIVQLATAKLSLH